MKIKKDVRYYNTAKYFFTNHFAIRKDFCQYVGLESVGNWEVGRYLGTKLVGSVDGEDLEVEKYFLQERMGYVRARLTTEARIHPSSHKVSTIIIKAEDGTSVGIDPGYTDLLSIGDIMIKGPKDPILVVADGAVRSLIMPIRL